MDQWRAAPRNGRAHPVIATGHQPTLWHPGILAKDLAAAAYAKHVGGSTLHVVVEHNPLSPLAIDLPTQQGKTLGTRRLKLDSRPDAATLPPSRLKPLEVQRVIQQIGDAEAASRDAPGMQTGLDRIAYAYAQAGEAVHLADQTSAVLAELMRPYAGDIPTLPTSALVTERFVERLLADPVECVRCYNRAALAYPDAGIRPLYIGRDVVEVPLWAQGDALSMPAYIDLGDSKRPELFTQATTAGQTLDLTTPDALKRLRPRAITLSAIMRSEHCDLFIHGSGGAVYDQVTERWWHDWVNEPLAPMAVVSADVMLDFDAPTATRDDLRQAVWFDHHLPFNVDRYTQQADERERVLVGEKRELLDQMNDDRDKRRRAKSFAKVHAINAELRERHADQLRHAHARAQDAKLGMANAKVAARRDWCFALYPDQALESLRQALADFP